MSSSPPPPRYKFPPRVDHRAARLLYPLRSPLPTTPDASAPIPFPSASPCPMAAIASAISLARPVKAINASSVSFSGARKNNVAFGLQPVPLRLSVFCAAKKETVDRVCDIVKKQLVLPEGTEVSGSSKFTDLGADSLDTVEIVMGLEEAFEISVEESSAQSILTVEDAAELIDNLVVAK